MRNNHFSEPKALNPDAGKKKLNNLSSYIIRMKRYPFKFLDSYDQNDTDIFFGRDEEIETLYEMVFQNPLLLVYGASGTGKTSLIQCGLAGKFKSYEWLALTVRRGSNINASLEKVLNDAGGNRMSSEDETDVNSGKTESVLSKLIRNVYLKHFKLIYLIFDQFEELYILGKKDEQEQFIKAVKEILESDQEVKLIISIREEYLGYLYDFERAVPQLLRKKLRVEPMNIEKVTDVLTGINNNENSIVHIKEDEIPAITEGIFNRLKGKKNTLTIELPYLQVFLDKLYFEITHDESQKAEALITNETLKGIGDIGDVLRDFLESQVKSISLNQSQAGTNVSTETIWKILSPFSTLEGTKEPILLKELQERLTGIDNKLIDDCLAEFCNRRILNFSENTNRYELAHDSLARCIAEKRSDEEIALLEIRRLIKNQVEVKVDARETFTEKQLNFIEPYLGNLKLSEEEAGLINESKAKIEREKKQKEEERRKAAEAEEKTRKAALELELQKKSLRKARIVTTAISILAALSVISLGIAVFAGSKAKDEKNKAIAAQIEADKARLKSDVAFREISTKDSILSAGVKPLLDALSMLPEDVQKNLESVQRLFLSSTEDNAGSNSYNTDTYRNNTYKIEVFYLQNVVSESRPRAEKIVTLLKQQFPESRVFIVPLTFEQNDRPGYRIDANQIRCERSELDFAKDVLHVINAGKVFEKEQPIIHFTTNITINYISIFVRNM